MAEIELERGAEIVVGGAFGATLGDERVEVGWAYPGIGHAVSLRTFGRGGQYHLPLRNDLVLLLSVSGPMLAEVRWPRSSSST